MNKILLAPMGWEERFIKGVLLDAERFSPQTILLPFSVKYEQRTKKYREAILRYAEGKSICCIEREFDYTDDILLYSEVIKFLEEYINRKDEVVLFNYTSTPRDIIWFVLHFLSCTGIKAELSYYRPKDYAEAQLSFNAGCPRMIIKRSGIVYPDKPTCILALSGYDAERLAQLNQQFEPRKILIGKQTGNQLKNEERNVSISSSIVDEFSFDCYDTSEESIKFLQDKALALLDEYNIIAASLGPKPCAITLFNLTQRIPEIGLVYIPANDYNEQYSTGLDESKTVFSERVW